MSLNKNNFCFYFLLFFIGNLQAQEEKSVKKDSIKTEKLEEVVVTGQINPQSINKSVFEVKVITQKDIQQQSGNNLADILNQTLNLNIIPNTGTGKSGVNLFGLNSQYFKVLIDNIPVINEEGFGNNIDLTLINLDDIERIEIVEGSMGVQYGANAVSGIINIITKKTSIYDTSISLYIQEETINKEYELFDQGRHIQSLNIKHNFNDEMFASVGYFRNDFAGYWNGRQGEIYDQNDGLRGHSWLPKTQQNAKFLLNYKTDNGFEVFYKFDYLNERINNYGSVVNSNFTTQTETTNPSAVDRIFTNNRFIHNLNIIGKLDETLNYNVSASYQEQNKDLERYTFYIRPQIKEDIQNAEYFTRNALFSRGTVNNLFKGEKFNMQAGYELSNIKGTGSAFAGQDLFGGADIFNGESIARRLSNYDFFTSSEIEATSNWSLKPGARISFSNLFGPQFMISLSSRLSLKNDYELRTVIGSSNRSPEYDELYGNFVDVNHNFQGNPNLDPEQGYSIFAHLKKTFTLKNNARLKSKLSASYLNLNDRIDFVILSFVPRESQYNNIDKYKAVGLFFENTFYSGRFKANLGMSFQGTSQILDSEVEFEPNDDFLFNFQLNSNITYSIPKWNSSFGLYFKHVGTQPQFVLKENDQGEPTYDRGETSPFSWLDATFKKSFNNNQFVVTAGARNILDINTVNTTAINGGTHGDAPTQQTLAYGRSFFVKLNYNLNF